MLLPKTLASIAKICGEDRSKFPLDTVELSRDSKGNALATVTDGKRFLIAKWKDVAHSLDYKEQSGGEAKTEAKPDFNVLIPVKPWEEIFKAIPKKCEKPALEHALVPEDQSGKNIAMETREDDGTTRSIGAKRVEGQFPNWRSSVPEYELKPTDSSSNKAVRIRVDAELLSELVKTVYVTAGKDNPYIDLIVPENILKPVEIRSNDDTGILVTGLLFPINAPETAKAFKGALPAELPTTMATTSTPIVMTPVVPSTPTSDVSATQITT
jgi:hypothetical protein